MSILKSKKTKASLGSFMLLCLTALFVWLIVDLYNPIYDAIKYNSFDPIKDTLEDYGIYKYILVAVFQIIFLVSTILPNQIIQILAGLTCGTWLGFACCIGGIIIGNTLIYIFMRNKKFSLSEKQKENLETIDKKGKFSFLTMLSLYTIPGIPYGVAALYAANRKIGFFKYILASSLCAIPATLVCTLFGNYAIDEHILPLTIFVAFISLLFVMILNNKKKIILHINVRSIRATLIWLGLFLANIITMIVFVAIQNIRLFFFSLAVFVGLMILYLLFNRLVSKIFEYSRRKYNLSYFQGPVKKANPFVYWFFAKVLKLMFFKKFNVKVDKKSIPKIKKPAMLLFNHPSKFDFLYSFIPLYPTKINPLVAYYYFCDYHVGRLIKNLGAISKYLYQPDIGAMKNIFRVIKDKQVLGLAPEGRLSAYGAMEKVIPSTARMIKKLGVPVIFAKINGAYLTSPKWAISTRKGQVEVTYKEILTAEQIKNLSDYEIFEILQKECNYDDFEWQKEKQIKFKGDNFAEGLEHILYKCPVCGKEFTYKTKGNELTCTHCNTTVTLDNYYNFVSDNKLIPANIKEWYLYQKECEKEAVLDKNYKLEANVTLKLPSKDGRGFEVVGNGKTIMTHEGIKYIGSINGEQKEILFKIQNIPALLFGVREDFEIYHDNTLFYFVPEDIKVCSKWSVVCEQLYNKYLLDNNLTEWEMGV